MTTHLRRRRGFTLAGLMVTLGLLGIFALVATQLLLTAARLSIQAEDLHVTAHRFESAMDRLRMDVWSAREVRVDPAGAVATLPQADGSAIVWRLEETGTVVRSIEPARPDGTPATLPATRPAADERRWEGLPAGLRFAADGPVLRVRLPERPPPRPGMIHEPPGEIVMASQRGLAGRTP